MMDITKPVYFLAGFGIRQIQNRHQRIFTAFYKYKQKQSLFQMEKIGNKKKINPACRPATLRGRRSYSESLFCLKETEKPTRGSNYS
jgi:hypothetical protein